MRNFLSDTIFKRIIREEQVGSTNDLAMSLLDSDEEGDFVVLADSQTSGRGRRGRTWHSPPGENIYMSLAIRPNVRLSRATILTFLTGVAVCNGLRACTGLDMNLKWPNDIIFNKRKIGGILIETRVDRDVVHAAVVGIGVNVNSGRAGFPREIKDSATSLSIETGLTYERDEIVLSVLKEFDSLFCNALKRDTTGTETYIDGSVARKLVRKWRERDITLGNSVSVVTSAETISGRAVDIDEMCRLKVLTDDGHERLIHSGDVTLRI